jgi:Fe-S-cluster containining protein
MFKLPILPSMKCDDGCGACCGPVTCTPAEFDAVNAYAASHGVKPRRQGITCPFFQEGRCSVHEARPFICRFFGHSPRLVCERGYNENISAKSERKITYAYQKELAKHGERWLHETVFTNSEIQSILEYEVAKS